MNLIAGKQPSPTSKKHNKTNKTMLSNNSKGIFLRHFTLTDKAVVIFSHVLPCQ